MKRRMHIYAAILLLFHSDFLEAQKVLYSPFIGNQFEVQVAGKTGNYYWVQKEKIKNSGKRYANSQINKEQSFDIYDSRMNLVKTIASLNFSDTLIKEYFVSDNRYFDQLILLSGYKKTNLLLERYSPEGNRLNDGTLVGSFPFNESRNSYLMVRSEDKSKILLLGFESIPSSPPGLHAILFDRDWKQLSYKIYIHPYITQPLIQEDLITYPIEPFNSSPIKLANNGQWLMVAPSRKNHNFLLFHFNSGDTGFVYKEIKLPLASVVEDLALSVSNEKDEVYAAILSRFRYRAVKNIQVIRYSLIKEKIDFDSSYRFNTLVADKVKNENLIKESFIAVSGNGFMLLKEYGRTFNDLLGDAGHINQTDNELVFTNNIITNQNLSIPIKQDEYTRFHNLNGTLSKYSRGDLNLFYLPAHEEDSCWTGIINKKQITELNSPSLSYLVIPVKNKIIFLYNSFFRNDRQYGSTTILDHKGNQIEEEGVVFWKYNNTLDFQQSRVISENEVAIPYEKNQRNGFAIIRF